MWERIRTLAAKELLHWRRDRLMTSFIFLGPLLILLLVAEATASETEHLPLAVLDRDRSALSREIVASLHNTRILEPAVMVEREADLAVLLDRGETVAAVVIPAGFERDLLAGGRTLPLQFLVDGSNALVAFRVQATLSGVVAQAQARVWERYSPASLAQAPSVEVRQVARWNESLDVGYRAIPAMWALMIYVVVMLVSSLGITRERELGTLEQLMILPLRRGELYLGKAIPAVVIAMVDFAASLALVLFYYGIPLRGSLGLLAVTTLLFVVAQIGMGMSISAVSQNQQQSLIFVFLIAVTDISFSGYLVAVENMPPVMRFIAQFVPLQYYVSLSREILIKGAGWLTLWPSVLALAGLGLAILALTIVALRQRLD
ncbi:MAG: ABC transporter permease [Chloroflexi bacterium]|nr:ABC transporter permease [Chloroflexota bacterium]